MTCNPVRQNAFVDHALVFLESRHVRIAEHRETVGRERESVSHGVETGGDGLVRQPVDQIEIDSRNAGTPEHVDDGGRLLITLYAVDRTLHDGIEALHSQARTVDAGQPHRLHHVGSQRSRIDLDRDLPRGQHEECLAYRRHQFGERVRRHDRRRTAAEMDMLDLDTAADDFGDQPNLAAERALIGRDKLVAADNLGMAAAIPAHLTAERHVQIQ